MHKHQILLSQTNGLANIPSIRVGHYPSDIAINPDTNKIYVSNYQSDSVSVIDLKTMDKKDIRVAIGY
jgi:DNA-binding beta-propeller fold protein YncE